LGDRTSRRQTSFTSARFRQGIARATPETADGRTGEIAIVAGELDGLHGDPADRFIAATAIVHDATLVTADERLLRWRHPLRRQNAEL
jgi:PIN domain nuclease of toxin-antitoxin system